MREKELLTCIWIHHIATFIGISEGIRYLLEGRHCFWRKCAVFLFTAFQSWAGVKILADLRNGRSRLRESYKNLEKIKSSSEEKRGLLWGAVLSSTLFKVLPVRLLE